MLFVRRLAAALLLAALAVAPALASARAGEAKAFTATALKSAEEAGKPIVVHVTAKWCSTCAAQIPVVQKLLKDPKYKDVVLFNVDFDTQKDALRKLNVQEQSTFVAFKGKKEVARSVGETDKASIQAIFDTTS